MQPQMQSCYRYFKVNVSCSGGYNFRWQSRQSSVCVESSSCPVVASGCVAAEVIDINFIEQLDSTVSMQEQSSFTFKPTNVNTFKYLIRKKNLKGKTKYQEKDLYKEKVMEIGKLKYNTNVLLTKKVIEKKKQKYKENLRYKHKLIEKNKQKYKEDLGYKHKLI